MQILNVEQGSDEWLEARLGVATASEFSNILTPKTEALSASIKKYAKHLALELTYDNLKVGFKSPSMEAGNELEPIARQLYQEERLVAVKELGMMISDCGNYSYSPDGIVGEDGLIEIKCLEANNHSDLILSEKLEMPSTYKCQVQGGLMISDRKWCDFVAYNKEVRNKEKQLIIIRVERDEEFIKKLKAGIDKVIELRDEFINKIKG